LNAKEILQKVKDLIKDTIGSLSDDFEKLPIDELNPATQQRLEPVLKNMIKDRVEELQEGLSLVQQKLEPEESVQVPEETDEEEIPDRKLKFPAEAPSAQAPTPPPEKERVEKPKVYNFGTKPSKIEKGVIHAVLSEGIQDSDSAYRRALDIAGGYLKAGRSPTSMFNEAIRRLRRRFVVDPQPILSLLPEDMREHVQNEDDLEKLLRKGRLNEEQTSRVPEHTSSLRTKPKTRKAKAAATGELTEAGRAYLSELAKGEGSAADAFRRSMISQDKVPAAKYSTFMAHFGRVTKTILERYAVDSEPTLHLLPEELRQQIKSGDDLKQLLKEGRVFPKASEGTEPVSSPVPEREADGYSPFGTDNHSAPTARLESVTTSEKVEAWNHLREEHVQVLKAAIFTDPPISDTWAIYKRRGASAPGAIEPLLKVAIPSLLIVLKSDRVDLMTPNEKAFRQELFTSYPDPLEELLRRLKSVGIQILPATQKVK
jgi:hypothetical protein